MPSRTVHDDPTTARHARDIEQLARHLERPADLGPLLARIGERRLVLLGEASHGTSEYYRWRAEITRRLIVERGLDFVAVEGDWPDCAAIDQWVRGLRDDPPTAAEALTGFVRWPTWMWANHEVATFLDWLRAHNAGLPMAERVRFHGLDVYSLWESMEAILSYLGDHHPDAMEAARAAYRCFEPYGRDPHRYAHATRLVPTTCEDEVVDLLRSTRRTTADAGRYPGAARLDDEGFDAEQNAMIAVNAERYYRAMVRGGRSSWNIRDTHMADTLDRLLAHHGPDAKAAVWAHNTHVGDARATPMGRAGLVSIGQLLRERRGEDEVVLVGFGSHEGTVLAADAWGGPMREVPVPPSPPGTHEHLIHGVTDGPGSLFVFDAEGARRQRSDWLRAVRGHRAIGVVYDVERAGNWVPTVMGSRYDAFVFFATTTALRPIHPEPVPAAPEFETYPFNE